MTEFFITTYHGTIDEGAVTVAMIEADGKRCARIAVRERK
jgi:hypothetical protein